MARKRSNQGDLLPDQPIGEPSLPDTNPTASPEAMQDPSLADPVLSPDANLDLELSEPPANPGEPNVLTSLAPLEERIRRIEESMARLQSPEGLEQRISDRLTSLQGQPETLPTPPSAPPSPNVLDTARAVVSASRSLLPAFGTAPPAANSQPPARGWLLREVLAELQAIYYMYVDPRYRLSWPGRIIPPVLLVVFLLSGFFLTYSTCGLGALFSTVGLGWMLQKPFDLLVCYVLYKVLTHEAQRYRETAPDLPSHLRL